MAAGERINKMQGFLLSIRVVTPILLMLCVGMLVRRLGWVDEKMLNVMDRLGFKLLLPTQDRKSTRLNSSHRHTSRMPSSA